MLVLLSPSKTLDFETPSPIASVNNPALLKHSEQLIALLRQKSTTDLMKLMDISEKLATLNYDRYQSFKAPFNLANAKHALLAFQGDVYDGLDAKTLSAKERDGAQHTIRILSGLYGLLKPYDLIQPYRLEMGVSLKNPHGKNLYDFWGNHITDLLNQHTKEEKTDTVLNLASVEYASVVQPKKLNAQWVTARFKEQKGKDYKVVGLFAKRARGMMARFIVQRKIKKIEEIQSFNIDSYRFMPTLSTSSDYVFARTSKAR